MTTTTVSTVVDAVNGPDGLAPDWDAIDWGSCRAEVERLRRRIFTASRDGDWARVRNLQKLMLRSRSNVLLSVRQVTQRNAGRSTAGVDGQVALTSTTRAELAARILSGEVTGQVFRTAELGESNHR